MRAGYVVGGLAVVALAVAALVAFGGDTDEPVGAAARETIATTSTTMSATTTSTATTAPPTTATTVAADCAPVTQPHIRVIGWFPDISPSNEATGLIDGAFVVGNAIFLQFPEAGGPAFMTVNSFVQGDPDSEIRSGIFDGVARALGEPGEGSLTFDASTDTVDGTVPLSVSTFPTGALPPDPAPEQSAVSIRVDVGAGTVEGTIDHPVGVFEIAGTVTLIDARVFTTLECYQSIREGDVTDGTP